LYIDRIEEGGLHEGIIQSINECHSDYKNLLYENIITTGGNTKFLNFNERLFNELNCTIDHDFIRNVKIFPQEKIKNSNEYIEPVIEGMKLFARNSSLIQDLAITKKEYDDIGFNIVWKTCY
jgi:actin-related protein